jgi:hypothetical protein
MCFFVICLFFQCMWKVVLDLTLEVFGPYQGIPRFQCWVVSVYADVKYVVQPYYERYLGVLYPV